MKKLISVLALSALASTVHAEDARRSLFQCGLKLGGTEVVYTGAASANSRTESNLRKRVTYRSALLGSDASGIGHEARSQKRQVEKRLPLTVTVAQFGCSW